MFDIYINGELKKITPSWQCVDAIIEKFIQNGSDNSTLIVERDGVLVYMVNR